ncbi:MAG TPA: hypothetical protein DEF51_38630, partial [Myxococcales bacterium]|nr:hypothetical protein [Myxococcales bacterium]
CGSGYYCGYDGNCYRSGAGCRSDADCGFDYFCYSDGNCYPKSDSGCLSDAECGAGYYCDSASGYCYPL